jgi:PAS domain S-box-containing protein
MKAGTASDPLRILHLEDNPADAELIQDALEGDGIPVVCVRVATRDRFLEELEGAEFDLVLSDYSLPSFDGLAAVAEVRQRRPDLPVIMVSGTIGEERAVRALKAGATDFVTKQHLSRLAPATQRALDEASERQARRLAERELADSRTFLERVVEASPDLIYVYDLERNRNVYANPQIASLLGLAPDEVLGRDLKHTVIHPDDVPLLDTQHLAMRQAPNGRVFEVECRVRDGKGRWRWLRCRRVAFRREDAAVRQILGVAVDVTERKREEAALAESESRFRSIVETTGEWIWACDASSRITYSNPAVESILGYRPEELTEAAFPDLVHPDDREALTQFFAEAVREGSGWKGFIVRCRHKDGTWRSLESDAVPILEDGRVTGFRGADRDITQRLRAEEQIREQSSRLLRVQRMESIGTLAGGIAHDLNNALAPILMGADVLQRKPLDDHGRRILEAMETSARRGSDLIRQLLTFARGIEGERAPLPLGGLVAEVERLARQTFPRGIEIRVKIGDGLSMVLGQPTPLQQVLMNLTLNARDAMPEGGVLEITAENVLIGDASSPSRAVAPPGPYVAVTVSDTGTGMSPEVVERIFDPFFTTKPLGRGTGLGLSTTLTIVRGHGGFIDVESRPGAGTTFRVYLPALLGAALPAPEEPTAVDHGGTGQLVLIIDDEDSVREMMREVLEESGYRVVAVASGRDGVAVYRARRSEIALVITDMAMPEMDGRATIRALREIDGDVVVVLSSGLMEGPAGDGAPAAVLAKPFTVPQLLETIEAVLARRAAGDPARA